ncbi:APC family permease [Streptomyces sp. NPDC001139]
MDKKSAKKTAISLRLRREVGLIGLTFLSLGTIIGSGWFLVGFTAAQAAGPSSLISWVLAGLMIGLIVVLLAELGAAYPTSGGSARYPHLALGPIPGFAVSWIYWLAFMIGAPLEAEVTIYYLNNKVHGLVRVEDGTPVLTGTGFFFAVILIAMFTSVNLLKVRNWTAINSVLVWWKLAIPVLVAATLISTSFHAHNFTTAGGGFAPFHGRGVIVAMSVGIVFALTGFDTALQAGGEARRPDRDMARALIAALISATLLYILLEVAFIGSLDPRELANGWTAPLPRGTYGPYATIATGLGLGWVAVLIYINAFISPSGTGLITCGASARISYAMSRNGYLPTIFERLNDNKVPVFGIIFSSAFGILLLIPLPGWQQLVMLISSGAGLAYAFFPISFTVLRKTDQQRRRPFRVRGGALISPLGFIAASLIFYWAGWSAGSRVLGSLCVGYALLLVLTLTGSNPRQPEFDGHTWKASWWVGPYLGGMALISYLGQFGGLGVIPPWWDIGIIAVFALVVFYPAVALALPAERIAKDLAVEKDAADALPEP